MMLTNKLGAGFIELKQLLGAEYCPVALPWFRFSSGDGPMDAFHRCYFDLTKPGQWWAKPFVTAYWPIACCWRAFLATWRHGASIKGAYGVNRAAQCAQMISLGIRHNIAPRSYMLFGLWDPARRRNAGLYVQRHEMVIVPHFASGGVDRVVHDKHAFFIACGERGVPTVPVVASFDPGGEVTWYDAAAAFPPTDLYLKPSHKSQSRGIQRWDYDAAAGRWHRDRRTVDADGLAAHLRRLASEKNKTFIVQSRVDNHPDLARFSNGTLLPLRVITGRSPNMAPVLLLSALFMPTGAAIASNFVYGAVDGGIAAGVCDNGVMTAAITTDSITKFLTHHPDTGARIEGERLPFWREMVDTALAAHQRFPEAFCVGWDIVMTPEGPMVLEGNSPCGLELVQRLHPTSMGETRYPEFFNAALAEHTGPLKRDTGPA